MNETVILHKPCKPFESIVKKYLQSGNRILTEHQRGIHKVISIPEVLTRKIRGMDFDRFEMWIDAAEIARYNLIGVIMTDKGDLFIDLHEGMVE